MPPASSFAMPSPSHFGDGNLGGLSSGCRICKEASSTGHPVNSMRLASSSCSVGSATAVLLLEARDAQELRETRLGTGEEENPGCRRTEWASVRCTAEVVAAAMAAPIFAAAASGVSFSRCLHKLITPSPVPTTMAYSCDSADGQGWKAAVEGRLALPTASKHRWSCKPSRKPVATRSTTPLPSALAMGCLTTCQMTRVLPTVSSHRPSGEKEHP
mmetsp:Transcript_41715/g.75470  ORF Transcript_41715/g.75470 Transcript_41715/m.75470 type:complete len:215 (+) Transcript_41715:645-1289(+)